MNRPYRGQDVVARAKMFELFTFLVIQLKQYFRIRNAFIEEILVLDKKYCI